MKIIHWLTTLFICFLLLNWLLVKFTAEHYVAPEEPKPAPKQEIPHILAMVASCESNNRQFNESGEVLRGRINQQDVGILQINEYYHLDSSKEMGLDIYTKEGNLAYGVYLYETQGLKPWEASKSCWSKLIVQT